MLLRTPSTVSVSHARGVIHTPAGVVSVQPAVVPALHGRDMFGTADMVHIYQVSGIRYDIRYRVPVSGMISGIGYQYQV